MLASGSFAELDHPSAGRLRTLGTPIRLAATPARVSSSPPRLGEHTRDVLQAAGVAGSDIDACMALLEGATV
jgi:crotonobetainyl-CoA:carnitine CoA-transferase CaiB-like acyl-CoA transferase